MKSLHIIKCFHDTALYDYDSMMLSVYFSYWPYTFYLFRQSQDQRTRDYQSFFTGV